MFKRVLAVLLVIAVPFTGFAQTETPAPSPTPDVSQMWTLDASVNALGTPVPAMDVVFAYRTNAGDVAIAVFLTAILILIWAVFLSYVLIFREQK